MIYVSCVLVSTVRLTCVLCLLLISCVSNVRIYFGHAVHHYSKAKIFFFLLAPAECCHFRIYMFCYWIIMMQLSSNGLLKGCFALSLPLSGLVSLVSLSLLSLERYSAVLGSPQPESSQQRRARLAVAASWLYSLLWTVPPLLGWSRSVLRLYIYITLYIYHMISAFPPPCLKLKT